jgi:ROS/MUCR transcriptional regulator protein.
LGREFRLTTDVFEEYAEAFDASVDQFHADATDRREVFLAYQQQYGDDVRGMVDEVATVEADAAALARAFVTARDVFDTYTREFYGTTAGGEPAGDSQPAGDTTPDSTDHEPEAGDVGSEIEISLDDDPEGSVSDETDHDTKTRDPSPAPGSVVNDDTSDADETSDDVVQCLVCEEYYQAITEPHLQTHGMTIAEYRDEHGEDVPLRPDDKR